MVAARTKVEIKNREKACAFSVTLYEMRWKNSSTVSQERQSPSGSGDRSEKIRTYNFPQNRVTDHRIGLTLHQLTD